VRSVISFLDLTDNAEIPHSRRDFDDSDSPSAVAYTPLGDTILVTHQGNDRVVGIDALNLAPLTSQITTGSTETQPAVLALDVGTGLAPQGVVIDASSGRLFTQDFMGRSVTVLNAVPLLTQNRTTLPLIATTAAVTTELLPTNVLQGKRVFYNAADPRMSADSYISCASCHVDGGHDGRVWDFTGRGEGLRRTTDLRGRSGMGHGACALEPGISMRFKTSSTTSVVRLAARVFLNLTPQQFAAQHPNPASGKTGLGADLDALAAYVSSLTPSRAPRSPQRNANGTFAGCCAWSGRHLRRKTAPHATAAMPSPTALVNVGTQSALSGWRLGVTLPGIDTPTLHGLHHARDLMPGAGRDARRCSSAMVESALPGATGTFLGDNAGVFSDDPTQGGGRLQSRLLRRYTRPTSAAPRMFRRALCECRWWQRRHRPHRHALHQAIRWWHRHAPHQWRCHRRSSWSGSSQITHGRPAAGTLVHGRCHAECRHDKHPRSHPRQWRSHREWFARRECLTARHRAAASPPCKACRAVIAATCFDYSTQLDGRDANGVPLAPPTAPSPQAPGIVSEPQSLTLAEGNVLHFVVAVSGTGPFL